MPEGRLRIVAAHPGPDRYGADRMLVRSVAAMVERGHEVTVVLPVDGPLVPCIRAAGATVVVEAFPVLRRSLLNPAALLRLAGAAPGAVGRLARLVRRLEPDLVYVNTLTLPHWLAAARLARRPAVCHVREVEDDAGPLVATALVAPLALATAVIANSAHTASFVGRRTGRWCPPVTVVHNGMEPPPAGPARHLADRVRLAVVGRLHPRKGQDVAIAALGLLRDEGRDVELHLVGDAFEGYEWVEQGLRGQALSLGVDDAVHFAGYRDDPWRVFEGTDVALVPSRAESLGNVAIEAMAAGRPVVASAVGGLLEVVTDGVTGRLVPPGDPRAVADAVGELLDDPVRAASLASAGAVDARSRFSFDRYAREVLAVVEGAVPVPPARARLRVLAVLADHGVVGGVETSVGRLAAELTRLGVDIEAAVLASRGQPTPAAGFLAGHMRTRTAPGARSLWQALQRADVVHVHAPTCLRWPALVVALARAARTPVVLTLHLPGYPPPRPRRTGRARMRARFAFRGLLLACLRVDVRTPSAAAAELARRRFRPVRVVVRALANGTPDRPWAPVDTCPAPLRALFVGRLDSHKRPEVFVEAVALARRRGIEIQGILAGDGPERSALEQLVDELDAPVRLLGAVPDAAAVMAGEDVLVLPSCTEGGTPLVVQEAAACGRPAVVRTSIEGMEDWSGAFMPVGRDATAADFADALERLARDRHELCRLGAAARHRFETGYTSSHAAARFEAVYAAAASSCG